jgi:deoxyribodipyrimidine photo-lyase
LEAPEQIKSPSFTEEGLPSLSSLGFTKPPTDERTAFTYKGGSEAALDRINHYFWDSNAVSTYKETRNGLIGEDYATRFSPWLANGSISAREIYANLEKYEQEVISNKSTYWVKFELLWRDYFKFIGMKYGRKIFFPGGIQDKNVLWKNDSHIFSKWALGQTGDAFVDANMRELLHSGWMSNRGRQNVASYLVHQLKQDWRKGAAWFESLLIDYDVTSNYGNWMYAAGVGNDPRDRIFNTNKQADRYDPNREFRNLWLDEPSEKVRQYVDYLF